jgi:hypothetical protein
MSAITDQQNIKNFKTVRDTRKDVLRANHGQFIGW